MKVKIKRFDLDLPLPAYKTSGAVALDLAARQTMTIPPGEVVKVPLNIAVEMPKGYWLLLAARSSLHQRGLMLANGIGIGDDDFCGDDDEYHAALWNRTTDPVTVERGERLCQMLVLAYERVEWVEVKRLGHVTRGGFGSTGR